MAHESEAHAVWILEAATIGEVAAALIRGLGLQGSEPAPVAWRTADGAAVDPEDADGPPALSVTVDWPAGVPSLDDRQRRLVAFATRRVGELVRVRELRRSVQSLASAEKLQRALFAIADLAGSELPMTDMLRGLHRIAGELMYAENFYIALHEPATDDLQFLYFADTVDDRGLEPGQRVPLAEVERGMTWYLIRDGRPLMGPTERLREQVSGPLNVHGADSHDFLGVPMLRDGRVAGALVVQSYLPGVEYTDADRSVLMFVAGHVLTAVERKQGQGELERRVAERTGELAAANTVLQQQIRERERAQHLQSTLYRIAALTGTEETSQQFYRHVHAAVAELITADNFYIALLSEDGQRIDFPYYVDEGGGAPGSRPLGRGLTEHVIRTGRTLLADQHQVQALVDAGHVAASLGFSSAARCWLGAPLLGRDEVIGVVAVQSYREDAGYSAADAELLEFVSYQIASSLRRRAQDGAMQRLNADLEQRVAERTQELRDQIRVREDVEARLKHQVMHDSLTALPNRLYLRDRLERAIAAFRRNGKRRFALMYLDVDRFKVFNDSLGHQAGDEVLRAVARRLGECVRDPDVVARLSGDEFAVLLEDSPIPQTASKVAQRILTALQQPLVIGGRDLQVSASIGIAIGELRHASADDVLHDADVALYRAKAAGRRRFVLFDDTLQRDAMDVLDLENQFRAGLENGEFEAWFQPIVRMEDQAPVGHEALVRWRHPQRGLLSPADFLVVAEDSGLVEAMDWQVYRSACLAVPLLPGDGYVTINLSHRHFKNEDFDARLLDMAADTGCDPRRLRVEVTEGTLLGDTEAVVRILGRLRDAGVEAALDDFGTGYSSLGYLQQFPLRMIKIDRSFVSPLGDPLAGRSSAIVGAILALAHSLDLEVVAEGVETTVQRDALLAMGCTHAQGFLFGRPAPAVGR